MQKKSTKIIKSTKQKKKMITIGVDSSTTNCGVAIFENGCLIKTHNYEFDGTYNLDKLEKITKTFQKLFEDYKPGLVVLETPAPVRNSKTLTALNQVAGAIWATAVVKKVFIADMHNKVIKKLLNIHSKQESIERVTELFGVTVKTDHESDAVLTVEAYRMMITQSN